MRDLLELALVRTLVLLDLVDRDGLQQLHRRVHALAELGEVLDLCLTAGIRTDGWTSEVGNTARAGRVSEVGWCQDSEDVIDSDVDSGGQ